MTQAIDQERPGAPTRLWWRTLDYAAVLRWQALGLLGSRGRGPAAQHGQPGATAPPVVLVPGVYEPWHFLRPLAASLRRHAIPVHHVPGLGRNVGAVPSGAAILARYLATTDLHDVVLVAHSKGGLIGKLAMGAHDPGQRISSMVTLNTPFAGSGLARWMAGRTLREFAPTNATILALAADSAANSRIVAVRSRWDPHIPRAGELTGATNVVLSTPGHFRPLADPRLVELVLAELGRAGPGR